MSTKEENKPLTLQECKDKVVGQHSRHVWRDIEADPRWEYGLSIINEAAELYASQFRSNPPEQWIRVKDRLPEDDQQLVIFIEWYERWKRVIEHYVSHWINVKQHREFDLKNNYTHWMPLPLPPGHKIDDNEKQ